MVKAQEIINLLRSPTVLTIILITGCYLILGWVIAVNGPALDDFQDEFKVSVDKVSLITAFMFIGMMIGDVIATWLLERPNAGKTTNVSQSTFLFRSLIFMAECGRRGNIAQTVLFQGVAVMSAAFFLISISTHGWSFGFVLVLYLITGIGNSLIDISANTIISALDPAVAGSLLNLLHLGFGVGATMAPYIFALFHMGKKYHIAFLFVSLGGAAMFMLLHFFLPRVRNPDEPSNTIIYHIDKSEAKEGETRKGQNEKSNAGLLDNAQQEGMNETQDGQEMELVVSSDAIMPDTPATVAPPTKKWEFKHLINIDFAMLMMSILSYNGAEIIIGEWAYDLMEEIGHVKYGTAATSLFWAGLLSGRLANSVLGQQFPGLKGTFLLLRITIVGAIGFPVLVVIFPTPPFSLVLFFASGLAYGGIFPFLVTIVAAVFPDSSGSTVAALGCLFLCGNFGATFFPYITGAVASMASVRTGMALAPFALMIVGFGVLVVWWKVKAKF